MENPFQILLNRIEDLDKKIEILIGRIPEERPLKRYTPQDIADNTPLSVATIWEMIKRGDIKAERIGRKLLITENEFDRACKDAKSLKYKRDK